MSVKKFFDADIMLRGRFVHTMRISILVADKLDHDGTPIFSESRLRQHIVSRLPSLKNEPFTICF